MDTGADDVAALDEAPGVLWGEYSIELRVGQDIGAFSFGMAETACIDCYTGEDCTDGSLCHEGEGDRLSLLCGASEEGLSTGAATAFTGSDDAQSVTFYLESAGDCYTWGHSPSYYSDCIEL